MAKVEDRNGVYLIKRPEVIPVARMLQDDPKGAERLQLYNEAVQKFGDKARKSLGVIGEGYNGSNVWAVSLFNSILPDGERMATPADLGLMVDGDPNYTRGFYVDSSAVVLRSASDSHSPNDYVARNLAKKLGIRSFKNPVLIKGLGVKEDSHSDYGLVFVPTDKTKVTVAPQLAFANHGKNFSKTNESGLPLFDENGSRTFYARNNGLSGLCLDRDLNLGSNGEGLANSNDSGRVVLVRDEVADADLMSKYTADVANEVARQQGELLQRRDLALKLLRGEK